jgi:hypothetical protein
VSEEGRLFAPAGSPAAPAARALSWLWRLGPALDGPDPGAVGFGTLEEQDELRSLLDGGRLAGLVLFAPDPGPADGAAPVRSRAEGTARFGDGLAVRGPATVFDGGAPAVRSTLGAHAVRDGSTLVLALDPATAWTLLRGFWAVPALADFLVELLDRPLVLLPPVGCVRLDDVPGTAQHQAQGIAHSDRRARLRVARLRRAYARAGARLNVAVCSRALVGGEEVPLDHVWPRSVAALADGVRAGEFEPVCHGYLHLDREELERGRVEYREFGALDERDARQRLEASIAWQRETLGRAPESFVAPAWSYSDGALAAAAAIGLPAWLPAAVSPMLDGLRVRESMDNAFRGLHGVGHGILAALAARGMPPTPVLHGGSFDLRVPQLREARDAVTAARMALARDIVRLPRLRGVRWVGTGELVRLLRAHDGIRVRGREVSLEGAGEALLLDSSGVRTARAA